MLRAAWGRRSARARRRALENAENWRTIMERKHGRFVWYELMTTDVAAAVAFYGEVVGWKTMPFGDGGPDAYQMWTASQGPMGGVITLPEAAKQMGAPPHWMAHVEVSSVDDAAARVKALGGRVF